MASITFDEIYSRFYTKVEAYDFLSEQIPEEMVAGFMDIWLRSSLSYPYISRLFAELTLNENEQTITYELKYKVNDFADNEFIYEVLSNAMIYAWIEPKVNSITNIYQTFGTSDEKFYSQAAHLSELRGLRDDVEKRIRSLIRDRGYLNNNYLDGNSASASIRG